MNAKVPKVFSQGARSKEIKQICKKNKPDFKHLNKGFFLPMDMEVCFMTYYLHKAHYSCKFQLLVTAKSDQDPDPYTDPHEYGHLDPDPH
jgi:hypothetical protein